MSSITTKGITRQIHSDIKGKYIGIVLKRYLSHKSKIVRVSAMEALAVFSERNGSILNEVIGIIKTQIKTGSPAVQSRGRKLLNRLGRKKN